MGPERIDLAALYDRLRAAGLSPKRSEPMKAHTSFRIGGPADLFVAAKDADQLASALSAVREFKSPFLVLGAGTNVLVGDRGYRGLIIRNSTLEPEVVLQSGDVSLGARLGLEEMLTATVHVASGARLTALSRRLSSLGLAGLTWAEGIPGTLGGAIVNNAGAFGSSMADVVRQVEWVDADGSQREWNTDEAEFGYRTSRFRKEGGRTITAAQLSVTRQDGTYLQRLARDYHDRRKRNQPAGASAGSIFKNPVNGFAGRLIEAVGLKGQCIGDARVSQRHANFIVNRGNATARDVLALIETIRATVLQQLGVELELEIDLVGEF